MRDGMRIMRSLTPARERDRRGDSTADFEAPKVRINSLSSAIVADMYIRRGALENVGNKFVRGKTGVIVNRLRLMNAWHISRLSRTNLQANCSDIPACVKSSLTVSRC